MAAAITPMVYDPTVPSGRDVMEIDSDANDRQAEGVEETVADTWNGIRPAPAPKTPRDTIHAVFPFSTPYKSVFSTKPRPAQEVLECLKNVNCSYLSSGVAPNLLQLKQHAQSLTVLIKEMTVSQGSALIDNARAGLQGAGTFAAKESFDWLNDLSTQYTTDESHHLQPLTSILNTVETDPVTGEARNICPLQKVVAEGDKIQLHPWATHESLIRHANELLERLDHEYSARGGLLSIFPTDMQKSDREKAEKTVLGQMIFWVQNLVQRIHHLERLYANAMDLLATEAVVPTETLSALGTKGRKGREVVYPQDRFVLVNAGDDLWDFLNAEFERKEVADTTVDESYRELGTTGEAIWAERGGREFAKGITCIDVYTRYYRLRDNELKTIFVIPAHEIHPGTKVTREMEQQPTVVSVVKPVWPERMSVLEEKHKDDMAALKTNTHMLMQEMSRNNLHEQELLLLSDANAKLREEKRVLAKQKEDAENALKQHPNQFKLQVHKDLSKASEARIEAARVRAIYEKQIADTKAALEKAQADAKEMQEAREKQAKTLAAKEAEKNKEWAKRVNELEVRDGDIGRAAQEVVPELKKVWLKQMTESQILLEFLSSKEAQDALKDVQIPDHIMQLGREQGRKLYEGAAGKIPDTVPQYSDSSSDGRPFSGGGGDGGGGPGGPGGTRGGGSSGGSRRSDLQDAPNTPSWRKKGSFSTGGSSLSHEHGAPRKFHYDALGKPKTGGEKSAGTLGSMHAPGAGWSPRTTQHDDPQNAHYAELGRTQRSPSHGRDSGSSRGSFHSPKQVMFSRMLEQGPSGLRATGAQKRPSSFFRWAGRPE
jgi:uncharacterized membrane protein YgcG